LLLLLLLLVVVSPVLLLLLLVIVLLLLLLLLMARVTTKVESELCIYSMNKYIKEKEEGGVTEERWHCAPTDAKKAENAKKKKKKVPKKKQVDQGRHFTCPPQKQTPPCYWLVAASPFWGLIHSFIASLLSNLATSTLYFFGETQRNVWYGLYS
jgi:hypothetical protein